MAQLALRLLEEKKPQKALKVLEKVEKELPCYNIPVSYLSGSGYMAQAYAMLGQKAKARKLFDTLWKNSWQYIQYYLSLDERYFNMSQSSCMMHFQIMKEMMDICNDTDPNWAAKHKRQFAMLLQAYQMKGGQMN